MWHEARKQERMIRGLIVDYRRRAERRKDFYEKIKADPTQFLQLHGRPCKIHLDPAIAAAGDSPAIMMPWQGDVTNMIDRFDARAHLDMIPEVKNRDIPPDQLEQEERHCNYERYRILAQNAFLGISEDKFLHQLALEEQFGVTVEERELQKEKNNEKKGTGVAIGYNYNDPGAQPSCSIGPEPSKSKIEDKDSDEDSDLEVIDVDLSIDVSKMEPPQAHELNAMGPQFGMAGCDLFSFLTGDADEAEHQKQLMREEKEKAMFSGRKSRRERRAHRDKKLASRVTSPPSYAAPSSDKPRSRSRSSHSKSDSPECSDKIEFITSFGGDDTENAPMPPKSLYSEKLKQNLKKTELYSEVARKNMRTLSPSNDRKKSRTVPTYRRKSDTSSSSATSKSRSRSRSRKSPSISRKSRSRSPKSRSKSRSRSRSRKSRSLSQRRSRSRLSSSSSRSRSRSRPRNYRRSRSADNYSGRQSKRYESRSTYESKESPQNKPLPRYYGRRKEDKSSSELSVDSDSSNNDEEKNKNADENRSQNQNLNRLSAPSTKASSRPTTSLKDRLKKKMQAQLSRQLRADQRLEAQRRERDSRQQQRRDHEIRDLAIRLRRRQREMRHQQYRRSSEESDGSKSPLSSRGSTHRSQKRDGSHSRSISPKDKGIPVWIPHPNEPPPPLPPLLLDKPKYSDVAAERTQDFERNDSQKRPRYEKPQDVHENRWHGHNDRRFRNDHNDQQTRYEGPAQIDHRRSEEQENKGQYRRFEEPDPPGHNRRYEPPERRDEYRRFEEPNRRDEYRRSDGQNQREQYQRYEGQDQRQNRRFEGPGQREFRRFEGPDHRENRRFEGTDQREQNRRFEEPDQRQQYRRFEGPERGNSTQQRDSNSSPGYSKRKIKLVDY